MPVDILIWLEIKNLNAHNKVVVLRAARYKRQFAGALIDRVNSELQKYQFPLPLYHHESTFFLEFTERLLVRSQ